jgi:site-specific recombinase XerD
MDESIQDFKRYLKCRYPGRSTAKHYVNDLKHFQRLIGKPPRAVTRQDVGTFIEDQLARGYAATTVNRRLASLHHFFEFLADQADDDTWANPVVWRRHGVKEGKPLPRDVCAAKIERLFAHIDHPRDRLMFDLMYEVGLRVGEVAALRLSDHIPSSNAGEGARLRVQGKGQKERVVPLTSALTQQWETWLAERPSVESDAVFVTRLRRGISVRGIQDRLAHYCRRAGVEVTCHQLRHTFGRRMAEGKMPVSSLSRMMGHAQVTTTQEYIAGAAVDVRADYETAMGRLEAERPGSTSLPSPLLDSVEVSPSEPDVGDSGAAARPWEAGEKPTDGSPEPASRTQDEERSADLSRFWAGLPVWLTEPLAEYIAHQRRRWKPSQRRRHTHVRLYALCPIWRWLLEKRAIDGFVALGRRDVQAYVEARLQAGRAASTINWELRCMWAFLRFVEERGAPVAPGVFRVICLKERTPLPRFLTEEEYQRLEGQLLSRKATGARDDRLDRAWFYLLAHGGLRLAELCDLRLGDVDLEGKRLVVREGKGKTDRAIPLSEATVTAVQDYLAVRGQAQTDHLLVFRQQKVKPSLVQGRLRRYGEAVEVEVSPHRLRHTLATRLVNTGMEITSIQHLLGHEKLTTTMIYAHVHDVTVERDFRQAIARLEGKVEQQLATMSLAEEFLSHTHEPVSTQELNCM